MKFEGRHVLITGGSSGIGKAIAEEFARLGSHVHIAARGKERLEQACEEIARHRVSKDQRIHAFSCDVSDLGQVREAFARLKEEGASPTVLINSAGIAHPGYMEEIPVEMFERMMQINYFGTLYPTKTLLPDLLAAGEGHIVNISSVAGILGIFGYTGYAASKFAVCGFSEALRSELKPRGIHVTLLCPPDTDTPQLQAENEIKPRETKILSGSVRALSAQAVAKCLLKAMRAKRFLVIPGWEGRAVCRLHRLFPGVLSWIMDAKIRRALEDRR